MNSFLDQIDSFISSDTEPNATEFSDTLDVIDNAYENIKYQKIKDIFLKDIKKDVVRLHTKRNKTKNKFIQLR